MFALARNLGATALLLALLALAPACASAAQVFPSLSPTVLRGPGPWAITYSVEFDAGPADEQIPISIGSSSSVPAAPGLDGPGSLTPSGTQLLGGGRSCSSGFGDIDFGVSGSDAWVLNLQAGARTVMNVPVVITRNFSLGEDSYNDVRISVDGESLSLPSPVLAVSREVPLNVRIAVKSALAGQRVPLIGATSPQLAGKAIDLRASYAGTALRISKPKYTIPVARVRVAADGSFVYRNWRPARIGRWSVAAFFDSHDPRFLDSAMSGCFPGITVTR